MPKSIKLIENLFWDSSSITHKKENLKNYLNDKENILKEKVSKNGDILTGTLTVNTNFFEGFIKERNINNINYQVKLGVANRNGEGAICIQLNNKDSGEWLSEIVVLSNGTILNGKTNQALIEESSLYHKPGEQITIGGYYAGTFTSANTSIQFTVTTPKWLDKVSKATIAGNVILRHADGGYIANVVSIASIGTVVMGYKRGNQLSFGINLKTPASNFTNNSVVSVTLQDCKITFS